MKTRLYRRHNPAISFVSSGFWNSTSIRARRA